MKKKISKLLKMSEKCSQLGNFPVLQWFWLVCQRWATRQKHQVFLSKNRAWDLKFCSKMLKISQKFYWKSIALSISNMFKISQHFSKFLNISWTYLLAIYLKLSPKSFQKVRVYVNVLAMGLKISRNVSRRKRIQHRHQAWNNLGMKSCARSLHKFCKQLRVWVHSKRIVLL